MHHCRALAMWSFVWDRSAEFMDVDDGVPLAADDAVDEWGEYVSVVTARTLRLWPTAMFCARLCNPDRSLVVARIQLSSRRERAMDLSGSLLSAFVLYLRRKSVATGSSVKPPCTWCGQSTGNFCDVCEGPVCADCDSDHGMCWRCHWRRGRVPFARIS